MPRDVSEIFARCAVHTLYWEIGLSDHVRVFSHFFSSDWIEFGIDPKEIHGQPELDLVCDFVRLIGRTLGKPVAVCMESSPEIPIMRYEPRRNEFARVPPAE